MTGINMGSQKEAGIRGSEHGAALEPPSPFHRQQVTVIKCFFISSRATTKGQNRIKQSGGMLALLMLRPFENMLAMRGSGMLQARIREQRDGEIRSAVWEPSSSSSSISTPTPSHMRRRHLPGTSVAWPGCRDIIRRAGAKHTRDCKCKVDGRAAASSNEMIHHFLNLSSLSD